MAVRVDACTMHAVQIKTEARSVSKSTSVHRDGVSRRRFLQTSTGAAAGAAVALSAGASAQPAPTAATPPAAPADARATRAYQVRVDAARYEREAPRAAQKTNGDEERYANYWASFSKGLPHNEIGEVDLDAYRAYIAAVSKGTSDDLEQIPMGGYLKLANPHAALAFDLCGPDSHQLTIDAHPAFDSNHYAAEIVELYWKSLLRDVPLDAYDTHELAKRAAAELSALTAFCGPRGGDAVTEATLCRGGSKGGRVGPYISQFLYRDIPFSPIRVPQKIRTAVQGRDYMTDPAEWLAIQNGGLAGVNTFEAQPRYVRTGRDLGEYVHRDFTYQAFLAAALILLKMSAPVDGAIPYQYSVNQGGFVTFGAPDILHLVAVVANSALKATWYQKWLAHRTARPEEVGGRVHFHLAGKAKYPLHADLLQSEAVQRVKKQFGSALLPQAYPEGAPAHPSYPAGHAVIAGACTTVLKAWFAESWVLPKSFTPSADGASLVAWTGPGLTVGGELDKLAENVAYGRNFAGVHTRSDAAHGLLLGEQFALRFLRETKLTMREFFHGFSLTKFDGTSVTV
jgi:membrane-associated phospholipid phosphatase